MKPAAGAVALFGERLIALSVGVLFAGMAVSIVWIIKVQRKYNNGIF